MTTYYSNLRNRAVIPDWPSGKQRVTATFYVESNSSRSERACRTTEGPGHQALGRPKKLTYGRRVVFADGDDGRLYILSMPRFGGMISVMKGTMDYQHETIFPHDPRYAELIALIDGTP